MTAMLAALLLQGMFWNVPAEDGFTDHGVAAKVAEMRGLVTTVTGDGRCLVICTTFDYGDRGYILVTDVDSGETKQHFCPPDVPRGAPFGSLMARNGKFYTTQGRWLLEFDPAEGEWTFKGKPAGNVSAYLCFTQGPAGMIWTGGASKTELISFNPVTREMKSHGLLDPKEHYLSYLAVGRAGWVYAGIGTARLNIIAYHPRTGEKRRLIPDNEREQGTARVFATKDGAVLGRAGKRYYRLLEGRATPIKRSEAASVISVGDIHYGGRLARFPDGRRVSEYDLETGTITVEDPKTKEKKSIHFDYVSGGALITSLAEGPNGVVYVSSCHPMHLAALDTRTWQLDDRGRIPLVGGGNFCSMACSGNTLIGAEYAGGRLWAYDVAKPWEPGASRRDKPKNPRVMGQWAKDICRPRAALAHPDGRHVMIAGFAGYGLCGGGIGIVDLETGEAALLSAEKDLLPGHSCITLRALPDGDLVGGTSVDAPGGGHATAKEAELFVLDWKTKKVVFRTVPVPDERNIISLAVSPEGLVYGVSRKAVFFVFDPAKREIVHRVQLAGCGSPARHALQFGPDGDLYGIFNNAIMRFRPDTFAHEKVARPPVRITAGGALVNGRLCFAAASHVWTWEIPGPARAKGKQ